VPGVAIEPDDREDAIRRLRVYFERDRDEPIGELAANLLLDFIAEEIAPYFFNEGVREAQRSVARHVDSLDVDLDAARRMPPTGRGNPGD
jgi:uncharacterized protein (DUF2164 family)